mgnify:CR=1 FL=1
MHESPAPVPPDWAVTGAATTSVITSTTEAFIADKANINTVAGAGDHSVRVRASDNTLLIQAGGTVSGAGAAAVSGTVNTGVIAKTTKAVIGDADVRANQVEVSAKAKEAVFTVTANASVAGAAGVGGAVSVNTVSNTTTASIAAGADVDASGNLVKHGTVTKTTFTHTSNNGDATKTELAVAKVINRKGFTLPVTGGFGTLLFSGIGVLLVLAGVGVLFSLKKKSNRA